MNTTPPCTSTDDVPSLVRPWYRRRWVIAIGSILICLILGLLVLTFVPIGSGEEGAGITLSVQATKFIANNCFSASSSATASNQDQFACRRIAVLNRSDQKIMSQVSRKIVKQLNAIDMIETVDFFDLAAGNAWAEAGGEVYDLYIVIDMPKFSVKGILLTGRTVDAKVTAFFGRSPWDSHHGYVDDLTPPLVRVSSSLTLGHNSVSTGYESASARYREVINDIAKQLGSKIVKQLQDWAAQYGQIDTIPVGMSPTYRPTPNDLPLPADPSLTQVISGRGFMIHNFTTWTLSSSDPLPLLRDLRDRLKAAGWCVDEQLEDGSWQYHLRAMNSGRVYEAYEVRHEGERVADELTELAIEYTDRMTSEEMRPAFEQMLADNTTPTLTLLQFSEKMPHDLKERLTEKLIKVDNLPAAAELRIVRYLHAHGKSDPAMSRLRAAYIASLIEADDHSDEIKKLGREITKNDQWNPTPPTEQELIAFGARQVDMKQPLTSEVALDETAVFFQNTGEADDSSKLTLIGVSVTRSKIPEGRYTLNISNFMVGEGNRSVCSSTPHNPTSPWHGSTAFSHSNIASWHVEADEIADNRFRMKLTTRAQE